MTADPMSKRLVSVDYEVFGRVQGVFYRKHAAQKSKELGLRGYVQNTDKNTVVGHMEGETDKICVMKRWLRDVGSPLSRVERVEFRNERTIQNYGYPGFSVRQ